ncbi:MAG: methyltransferase domain-containing protein [Patescibacteria group bacterium]|nr:methyltransferase domain-containing protein [Patescibacteria group bacterium]
MWQKKYQQKKFYWGLKPSPVLVEFLSKIPKGKILDIGAGEGRNSIFLAKNGFKVEAIDKIAEGLKKCRDFAKKHNLLIKTKVCDIRKFGFKANKYSLIISTAALDFLKKSEIELVVKKIKKSLVINGFIYFLVFSTKDPLYQKVKKLGLKKIEKNTYYLPKHKIYRHFFTQKELKEKFEDFKIVYLKQKKILDTGHGKPHYHSIIELLAQKKKAVK